MKWHILKKWDCYAEYTFCGVVTRVWSDEPDEFIHALKTDKIKASNVCRTCARLCKDEDFQEAYKAAKEREKP